MKRGLGIAKSKEERLMAMGEAYSEAAEHLRQCGWSHDELELECGNIIAAELEKKAVSFTIKAMQQSKTYKERQ